MFVLISQHYYISFKFSKHYHYCSLNYD